MLRTLPRMTTRRDTMLAAQYFVAVCGVAAMRHVLTEPSAVRPRRTDLPFVLAWRFVRR